MDEETREEIREKVRDEIREGIREQIREEMREYLRAIGAKGGQARAKNNSPAQLRKWAKKGKKYGKRGGRPPKNRKGGKRK